MLFTHVKWLVSFLWSQSCVTLLLGLQLNRNVANEPSKEQRHLELHAFQTAHEFG